MQINLETKNNKATDERNQHGNHCIFKLSVEDAVGLHK